MELRDLKDTLRRTRAYWFIDGFAEIGFGWVMFALAGSACLADYLSQFDIPDLLALLLQPVIVIAVALLVRRWVQSMKERWTYPLRGYVQYPRPGAAQRWNIFFLAFVLAASISMLISILTTTLLENWIPVCISAILAALFALIGFRFRLRRIYLVSLGTAASGALASLLTTSDAAGQTLTFAGCGLAWFLSGLATFLRHQKQSEIQPGDME